MLAPNFGFLAPMEFVRFWGSVQTGEADECWPWRHSTNSSGYGCFSLKGRPEIASRIAYQTVHGPIQDDQIVRHSCDNPPCCNPRHLLTGTHLDNAKDRHIRGRTNRGRSVHTVVLTEQDVLRIRATPQGQWSALAKELGVARSTLYSAAVGQSWSHLPNAVTDAKDRTYRALDAEKVRYIRTCGLTDAHLAREFDCTETIIKKARTGKTWKEVDTPPDLRPRLRGGSKSEPRARIVEN